MCISCLYVFAEAIFSVKLSASPSCCLIPTYPLRLTSGISVLPPLLPPSPPPFLLERLPYLSFHILNAILLGTPCIDIDYIPITAYCNDSLLG